MIQLCGMHASIMIPLFPNFQVLKMVFLWFKVDHLLDLYCSFKLLYFTYVPWGGRVAHASMMVHWVGTRLDVMFQVNLVAGSVWFYIWLLPEVRIASDSDLSFNFFRSSSIFLRSSSLFIWGRLPFFEVIILDFQQKMRSSSIFVKVCLSS